MNLINNLPTIHNKVASAPSSPFGGKRRRRSDNAAISLVADDPTHETSEQFRTVMNDIQSNIDHHDNTTSTKKYINVWRCPQTGQDIWEHEQSRSKRRELKQLKAAGSSAERFSIKASHLYGRFQPTTGHFGCRACGAALFGACSKLPTTVVARPNFERAVENHIRVVPGTKRVYLDVVRPGDQVWQFDTQCAQCQAPLGRVSLEKNNSNSSEQQSSERHIVHGLSLTYHAEPLPKHCKEAASVLFRPTALVNRANSAGADVSMSHEKRPADLSDHSEQDKSPSYIVRKTLIRRQSA